MNVEMLQRQIMYKQLQELQRNQQLQELGDPRNQEYINQLASWKQASALQFSSTVNGEPLSDMQVQALRDMQMMQHDGPNVLQGIPNGFIGSQGQNHGLSLSKLQFGVSGYGSLAASNTDGNQNLFHQYQGSYSQSDNMMGKDNNRIHGMSGMQTFGFPSSFPSRQPNFPSDRMSMANGTFVRNQMLQGNNNLFGQIPVHSLNNETRYANCTGQRIGNERHEDISWNRVSPVKPSDVTMRESDTSLDPLERKILYETDDDNLGSLFGGSQIGKGGFKGTMENMCYTDKFPLTQSGSWSALMQAAVAETSSSDSVMQEDWTTLNFRNQEQPNDNISLAATSSEKLRSNWVDRNFRDVSSQNSKLPKADINYGFPGFQPSVHQHSKHEGEFLSISTHPGGQLSQQNHSTAGTQFFKSEPSSNALPSQSDEARGTLWRQGSTSTSKSSSMQDALDQANKANVNSFFVESHKMVYGLGEAPTSTVPGGHMDAHSSRIVDLFNKDDVSSDMMQLNSRASYSSMENSGGASIRSPYVNHYINGESPQNHMATKLTGFNLSSSSQVSFKPSVSAEPPWAGTSPGPPTSRPRISSQQDFSSAESPKFGSDLFRSCDSSPSHLETNSGAPSELPMETGSLLNSITMHNLIPTTSSPSQHPPDQADKRDSDTPDFPAGIRAFGQNLSQSNLVLHQAQFPRLAGMDLGKKSDSNYGSMEYRQALSNAKELSSGGQKSAVEEKEKHNTEVMPLGSLIGDKHNEHASHPVAKTDQGKASALADTRNFQQMGTLQPNDVHSHSTSTAETYNGACPSEISLQTAPSWFKNDGSRIDNSKMTNEAAAQSLSLLSSEPSHKNDVLQGKPAIPIQGNGEWPASSSTIVTGGQLLEATLRNLDVPLSKKRKVVEFESVPWHKEVTPEAARLQNISSMPELEWAQASNCRPEEAKFEAEIIEELPVIQAKRRLVFTTLLMQCLLRSSPAPILAADAISHCDSMVYFASRLALGDACNLNSEPASSDADDMRTHDSDIGKKAKDFAIRVQKTEADISRLDKISSMIDVKDENQEVEKLSMINRFAKIHLKSHPGSGIDQPSSSVQRYVTAYRMPKSIPEELDCVSL